MFLKNYSDADFVVNYHSNSVVLEANTVTYIEDSWISLAIIKAMFGDFVEEVNYNTPLEDFLLDNKKAIELNKIYEIDNVGPGVPRIFVEDAKVDIYFSDEETADNMLLFTQYENVNGLIKMEAIPRWIMIKNHNEMFGISKVLVANINFVGE